MNIVSKTKVSMGLRFSVEHNIGLLLPCLGKVVLRA